MSRKSSKDFLKSAQMAEEPKNSPTVNNMSESNIVKRALTRLSLNMYETKGDTKEPFNFTTPEKSFEERNFPELDAFEAHSIQEDSEWETLIKNLKRIRADQKPPKVDFSVLSKEQRDYLNQAPCMQTFIKESLEFQNNANTLLNLHVKEMLDIKHNLMQTCKRRLAEQQATLLSENLANLSPTDKAKSTNNIRI